MSQYAMPFKQTLSNSVNSGKGDLNLDSIQYLRGLAAILVVIYHVFPQLQRMGLAVVSPQALSTGVDIFFIISGFVMIYTTGNHPDRSGIGFLRDRILRIVPLYWLLSIVMLMTLVLFPRFAQTSRLDAAHAAASFLFIPWMHPVLHRYWPMLVPGWTLNYEMFFYLIFSLLLTACGRRRTLVAVQGTFILFVLSVTPAFIQIDGIAAFYTRSQIMEFGFGMLLCELFLRAPDQGSTIWPFVIGAGVVGLALSPWLGQSVPQAIGTGIPALLVVMGAIYKPIKFRGYIKRLARLSGDASYSIYLTHYMSMSALGQIWRKFIPANLFTYVIFFFLAIAICFAIGVFVFYFIERPVNQYLRRVLIGPRHPPFSS